MLFVSCECTILTGTILMFDWPYSLPLQVPYLLSFLRKGRTWKFILKQHYGANAVDRGTEYSYNVSKERVRTFSKSLGSFSSDNVP